SGSNGSLISREPGNNPRWDRCSDGMSSPTRMAMPIRRIWYVNSARSGRIHRRTCSLRSGTTRRPSGAPMHGPMRSESFNRTEGATIHHDTSRSNACAASQRETLDMMRLTVVKLFVKDQEEARRFYVDKL